MGFVLTGVYLFNDYEKLIIATRKTRKGAKRRVLLALEVYGLSPMLASLTLLYYTGTY